MTVSMSLAQKTRKPSAEKNEQSLLYAAIANHLRLIEARRNDPPQGIDFELDHDPEGHAQGQWTFVCDEYFSGSERQSLLTFFENIFLHRGKVVSFY